LQRYVSARNIKNLIYINSIVLPKLGEEHVPDSSMLDLARKILCDKFRAQEFVEHIGLLINEMDKKHFERVNFKSSIEFVNMLNSYIVHLNNKGFSATDINIGKYEIILCTAWFCALPSGDWKSLNFQVFKSLYL
jgi:DNA helicase IV